MAPSTFFRSEEMSLVQLFIPSEVARITISHLGEKGLVQFRDLNPSLSSFQRSFISEIKKLDGLERQLRLLSEEAEKQAIPISTCDYDDPEISRIQSIREIDELHDILNTNEQMLDQLNSSYSELQRQYFELIEQHAILQESSTFFREDNFQGDGGISSDVDTTQLLLESGPGDSYGVRYVVGVISRQRCNTFERVLWRSLRGNLYMKQSEIQEPLWDPQSGIAIPKNAFVIFSHGQELLGKIRKISEAMGATLHSVDDTAEARMAKALRISARIEDIKAVMDSNNQTRRAELSKISISIPAWYAIVKKEKALYYVMNLFNYDRNRRCLIAEGWCPTNELESLQSTLKMSSENA
ncbi:hypothetical protein K493DRAFT_303695, partial [Basidiobolus meristosporus CBS 931.73]